VNDPIGFCIDLAQKVGVVDYGQSVLIASGVLLWVAGLTFYRFRTRGRRYMS
jgi:hypothetical protein